MAEAKAQTELLVANALKKAKLTKIENYPISVRLVWFAPDARRRDSDGLAPMMKAILDALVKKKVIEDDSNRFVSEVTLGPIVIARDNPRFEVYIRGLEAGGVVPPI